MQDVVGRLEELIPTTAARLKALPESEARRRPAPGKWSKKGILGHLIDSAANNHLRFLRAQLEAPLLFPAYAQEAWVELQAYRQAPWEELIQLWANYNRHLARVIANIPDNMRAHRCQIGNGEPVTLDFLVRDYLRHLEHHLGQILA